MTITVDTFDNMQRRYVFQDDGTVIAKATQDCTPTLEFCDRQRKAENQNEQSGEFKQFASIPTVIVEKIKNEKGIDINNRNHWKDFLLEIELNYPHLKTTNLKGW